MEDNVKVKKVSRFLLITLAVLFLLLGVKLFNDGLKPQFPQKEAPTVIQNVGSVSGVAGEKAMVIKVIDGDTIELDNEEKVRYIGIDTPETVDPWRGVGCFGKEASDINKSLVADKRVILVKDVSNRDKYGRLLRYVYLEEGNILVNEYLVKQGFAKAYTYPPDVKFSDLFIQAEKEARENKRGLWGKC